MGRLQFRELEDPIAAEEVRDKWVGCDLDTFYQIAEESLAAFTPYQRLKKQDGTEVEVYEAIPSNEICEGFPSFFEKSEVEKVEQQYPQVLWKRLDDFGEESRDSGKTELIFKTLPTNIPAEKIRHELRITPTQFLQLLYDNELEVSPWPPNGLSSDAIGQYKIDIYSYEQYCERNDIVSGLLPKSHPNSPFYPPFPEDPDYSDPVEAQARIEELEAENERLKEKLEEKEKQSNITSKQPAKAAVLDYEERIPEIVDTTLSIYEYWNASGENSPIRRHGFSDKEIEAITNTTKRFRVAIKKVLPEQGVKAWLENRPRPSS